MRISLLRQLDLLVLFIMLPVFIVAGFPLVGYAAGGGVWLAQRGIQIYATRKAVAAEDVRTTVGVLAGSMIGRGWLAALTIFAVGVGDNQAGLAAAVLFLGIFTIYFTLNLIMRPIEAAREDAAKRDAAAAAPSANEPVAVAKTPVVSTAIAGSRATPVRPLAPNGDPR
jgi:predicted lipid-binding transport protein (Tim44 family)